MGILQQFTGTQGRRDASRAGQQAQQQLAQGFADASKFLTPFQTAGTDALTRLNAGIAPGGEFDGRFGSNFDPANFAFDPSRIDPRNTPGFNFRLGQGQAAIDRSAAARGKALSGQTLKALARFGQQFASEEFKNANQRALQLNQQRFQRARDRDLRLEQRFDGNQQRRHGRLADLVRLGQQSATNLANLRSDNAAQRAGQFNQTGQQRARAGQAGIGNLLSAAQIAAGLFKKP